MMMNESLAILLSPPRLAVLLLAAAVMWSVASYLLGISSTDIVTSPVISMRLSAVALSAACTGSKGQSSGSRDRSLKRVEGGLLSSETATRFHPVPSIRIVLLRPLRLLGTALRFHPGRSLRQSRRGCRAGRTKALQVSPCSK